MTTTTSNPFGSFGTAANRASAIPNEADYDPPLGLRQRRAPSGDVAAPPGEENTHPNDLLHATRPMRGTRKVPAPPRMSLSTAGKAAFPSRRDLPRQAPTGPNAASESQAQALVLKEDEEDLTLWVVGYGYRTEAHFRALYHRLEGCGTITARRGGLACAGEDRGGDDGGNWVAVRYATALSAHKALCQDRTLVDVGGATFVIGVMPVGDAARWGLRGDEPVHAPGIVPMTVSRDDVRQDAQGMDADVLLEGGEARGGIDGLCGKVLAWFFMWETNV